MKILFAVSSIILGTALLTGGYRAGQVLIPLWVVLTSFLIGDAVTRMMLDMPLIALAIGTIVAVTFTAIIGVLALCYYPLAVVALFGSLGYWLGESLAITAGASSLLLMIGLIVFMVGAAMGAFLLRQSPKWTLITGTSIAGALTLVSGVLLMFHQVDVLIVGQSTIHTSITSSFLWFTASCLAALVGATMQYQLTRHYKFTAWSLDRVK